jgi:hypothetical protein
VLKGNNHALFGACQGISDLNGGALMRQASGFGLAGGANEHRQDAVRAGDGFSAVEDLSS